MIVAVMNVSTEGREEREQRYSQHMRMHTAYVSSRAPSDTEPICCQGCGFIRTEDKDHFNTCNAERALAQTEVAP